MSLLYLAGKFRDTTCWRMICNVRRAEEVASELWQCGYAVLSPHLNHGVFQGMVDEGVIMAACMIMVDRSDGVVVIENWDNSEVAQLDFVVVSKRGIVVIEVKNWSDEYLSKLNSYQKKYGGYPPHHQVDRAGKLLWSELKSFCKLESPPVTRVLLSTYGNIPYDPKYEYVNVKNLENINSFIQTRNKKLSEDEVERVVEHLKYYLPKKNS